MTATTYEHIPPTAPGAKPIKAWIKGVHLEDKARQQAMNVATLPFVYKHMALMPDCHWGMGATIGSVIATKGAIVPAAVGVDLGCGMMAVRTKLFAKDLPDNLAGIRSMLEARIPHGRTNNGGAGDRGAWGDLPENVQAAFRPLMDGYGKIIDKHPKAKPYNVANHMGTLGTGNHFVELCLDLSDQVWMMLHSGSRGPGNRFGSYFIEKAKEDMRRWFINLPDEDLAYIPEGSELFDDYMEAVDWAQAYALKNREVMMATALNALEDALGRPVEHDQVAVNCHHNYVARENHYGQNVLVTRKGAVRARVGDLGIIPGSMGARSFIVRGKGNPESFCSCSHGAGRMMSRGEARKRFTVEDHIKATAGVECRKDSEVIDETPGAYKPIEAVMAAQADLVEVAFELRQIVCVKG